MAHAPDSPASKARALQCGAWAVVWDRVQSLTGLWAHQGLQVPKSEDCSMPVPVHLAVEGMSGVALCDPGALCQGPW